MTDTTKEPTDSATSAEGAPDVASLATTVKNGPRLRLAPLGAGEVDADAAYVTAAQKGDAAAFERLFERHHGRVYAMCCRLLRDAAEVEDAVQQTFLEAWRCLPRFEGRSRFSTWITRVAIHTCLGFRRRLKRLFLMEEGFDGDLPAAIEASPLVLRPAQPDEGAAHRARQRAVDDVLQNISPKKRVVFVLAELEGMSAPEISEIVAIPEATVRTRLFHARKEFADRARRHPGFADLFPDEFSHDFSHDGADDDARKGGPR